MRVTLTRHADGTSLVRCERADGTSTWQRHGGHQAAFFPLHDLVHFAVETELGFRHGFFGLIADGWDIAETEGRGTRGALPPEAITVEHLVGLFSVERASGAVWTSAEFVEQLAAAGVAGGLSGCASFSDESIARVRSRRAALFEQWAAVAPAGTLELAFDRTAMAT
jgi:hypothetical protein